jgi:branched-chain amino acid aminotransferase
MKLAKNELGVDTIERTVDRSELYLTEECFLTGTAAHITPIIEIDHRMIGTGKIGKITAELQKLFSQVILGRNPRYAEWYTLVSPKSAKM